MAELRPENIKRVVVRGTNWVGDTVMTVPALRELRRLLPDARITLCTRPWARGLFADADFVDDLLVYDRRGLPSVVSQIGEWRTHSFDLAVLFQNAFEAALIPALARVPFRLGYATEGRSLLLTHPLSLPEWRSSKHEVFYYLNIVHELERQLVGAQIRTEAGVQGGKKAALTRKPGISLSISNVRQAEGLELLRGHGLLGGRPLIALCPGSINSRAKRWPAERYAALADMFIEASQAEVLLIGSQEELDVSLEVSRQMRNQALLLTGKTDLSQAAAVLSLVDLLVTNDTGSAHIAAALERPILVIFGPTNPLTTMPFSTAAELVRHPPDCAPCMLRDCPIDHRCMTAISPEEVFDRARVILDRAPETKTERNVCPTGAVA
jgi:heptosyltransferase-2